MKLAALVVPVVVAVAAKVPAVVFAISRGEVAMPDALVTSVAWLAPPTKLAAAALPEPLPLPAACAEREGDVRALQRLAAPVAHLDLQRLGVMGPDDRRPLLLACGGDRGRFAGAVVEREGGDVGGAGRSRGCGEPAGRRVGGEARRGGDTGGIGGLGRLAGAVGEAAAGAGGAAGARAAAGCSEPSVKVTDAPCSGSPWPSRTFTRSGLR